MANATPIVTTVKKNANNEKAPDAASRVNILDFCEEHYEDILPIIMEKARRDKRKEWKTLGDALPKWCHMFNSTLIGAVRVWFDELPPESIYGYKGLKAAFLAYFMQQNKYVKDPVENFQLKKRDEDDHEGFP
ncbi:hypothetical protein Tco_1309737 [Tanacetum coccineum]